MNYGAPRVRVAIGFASLLAGVVFVCVPLWNLLAPGADNYTEAFSDTRSGYEARAFAFEQDAPQADSPVRRYDIQLSSSVQTWGQQGAGQRLPSGVSFRLGLSRPHLAIESAVFTLALGDPAAGCLVYRAGSVTAADNSILSLDAVGRMDCPQGGSARLSLVVARAAEKDLPADYAPSLWTVGTNTPTTADFSALRIAPAPGLNQGLWSPQGGFVFPRADLPRNRSGLAAFVWGVSLPAATSWVVLWMVVGAIGLGVSLYSLLGLLVDKAGRSRFLVTGLLLLLGSSTMLQATLTPPLHGPDEPDHILTLFDVMGHAGQKQQLLDVARKTHFEQIKFNASQPFTTGMVFQPSHEGWASHIEATTTTRSALHSAIWPHLRPIFSIGDMNLSLLLLRILHAAMFMAFAAVCVWVLGGSGPAWPYLLIVSLAPTLPFFGTMFSNYPFLVYSSLVIGACLYGEAIQSPHGWRRGFALGAAVLLGLLSAQTGPAAAVIGLVILLAHPFVIRSGQEKSKPFDMVFLCCFAMGSIATGWALWSPAFWNERALDIVGRLQRLLPHLGPSAAEVGQFAARSPILLLGVVLATAMIFWWLSSLVQRAWSMHASKWSEIALPRRQIVCYVVLAFVCLAMLIPLVKAGLPLQNIEDANGAQYTPAGYIKSVFITMARSLAAGRPDYYLTWTYWGGFGWLDALLSESIVAVVKNTVSLSIVVGFWLGVTNLRPLSKTWLSFILISLAAALLILGLGAYSNNINLHGRYLIPFYVPLAGLAAMGLQFSRDSALLKFWPLWCLLISGYVHSQVWNLLLTRYYLP